ncbi:YbhB/YbcL family Raf kinase inhibitor-like protein [Weissella paramesenteroides]|uniref:YbhB/YbcL family Raf kinase inhibitor-like protein n=1 Tax=Weissella paramesenteroides TaxID=1249 RepID=UPI0023F70B9C|nr:YbhB/YbcL family Raf kinase inhibitor-like protein [Weissella paramesenteroides]MDF8375026.1 YbhB/YbcL family Raf kinase inhibitor-like protein [Weissella paramesenteroides]
MKIDVALDNNLIPDKYAKFAPDQYRLEDTPVVNFPIKVSDVPTGTESLSVVFIDYDSVPVAGFVWIHWLAANLPVGDIPEDLSHANISYVPGTNSQYAQYRLDNPALTQSYTGPMPPDTTHDYTLKVFALDTTLDLKAGYFLNDFRRVVKGHVLDTASLDLPARSK